MAVRPDLGPPVPPASLLPLVKASAEVDSHGSVIGLTRVDGGAWGRFPSGPPTKRLEVEARLPTQHWSSPEVVPVMVAAEAPRLWTRLRRDLPAGWQTDAEVRWESPSLVLRLTGAPVAAASRRKKASAPA